MWLELENDIADLFSDIRFERDFTGYLLRSFGVPCSDVRPVFDAAAYNTEWKRRNAARVAEQERARRRRAPAMTDAQREMKRLRNLRYKQANRESACEYMRQLRAARKVENTPPDLTSNT